MTVKMENEESGLRLNIKKARNYQLACLLNSQSTEEKLQRRSF